MRILSVALKNFRNIKEINIEPHEKMNVICGENAQGKTNLLESLWLFTGAKSFRGTKDKNLVSFGEEKCVLKAEFFSEEIKKSAKIEITERRSAFLNGKKLSSPSKLAEEINAVVFSPADLKIVSESPKLRRNFLDAAICQIYPAYIEILKDYLTAVAQRNKVLKEYKNENEAILDIFEREIAINGRKIIKYRKRYIEILKDFLPDLYNGISSGEEKLELEYIESFSGENFEEGLKLSRREDIFSQKTSIGPHRDDLEFKINGISARNYGSQGQKRSVALSLKLAEAGVLKEKTGEYPVCLLDDVMSELDPKRQDFILNNIKNMQTFITCCDPDNIKNLSSGKTFSIKGGAVL